MRPYIAARRTVDEYLYGLLGGGKASKPGKSVPAFDPPGGSEAIKRRRTVDE
jgi:hypothetical protein